MAELRPFWMELWEFNKFNYV